jgi:hypothetical protein
VRTEQRTRDLQRFVAAFDNKHTVSIEPRLRQLKAPTLIVWGTDDIYFPVKWAHWLADTIPGAKPPVESEALRRRQPIKPISGSRYDPDDTSFFGTLLLAANPRVPCGAVPPNANVLVQHLG